MTNDRGIEGYREFLGKRDGEPDIHAPALSRREEFFEPGDNYLPYDDIPRAIFGAGLVRSGVGEGDE